MRTRRARAGLASIAVAALIAAGCGDGDDTEEGAEVRIEQLEEELEETRESAEDLLAENERLLEEIRQLTTGDPDDADDPDESDESDEPDEPDEPEEPAEPDAPTAGAEPQPIRTAEGLIEQLRTLFAQPAGPDDAWEPGTTGWRQADQPAGLADSYDSPGELALDVAAALDADMLGLDSWETTTRVLLDEDDQDLAYIGVLSWGFADDSVIGRDLRMTITHDDGQWSPGGAEQRFHCMRGVTDEDLCL